MSIAGDPSSPPTKTGFWLVDLSAGLVKEVVPPLLVSGNEKPMRRDPFRREHTNEIPNRKCGCSVGRFEQLKATGVFGDISNANIESSRAEVSRV